MTKISVTGPKHHLQSVIDTLYELNLLHIEDYDGELETGEPFEEGEELSQMLVDVRAVLSKLPEVEDGEEKEFYLNELQENLEDVRSQLENIEDRRDEVKARISEIEDDISTLSRFRGIDMRYEELQGSETLEVYAGEFDTENFREVVETDRFDLFNGESATVIFYDSRVSDDVEEALREIGASDVNIVEVDYSGSVEEVIAKLESEKESLEAEREDVESEMRELAEDWRSKLEQAERFLAEKVEKAEAPLSFATTDSAFIAEGWVPAKRYEEIEEELIDITDGTIHVQREEGEEPPVKHENSRVVQPFESLTDLISVPRYHELDPSFMIFLTFPAMFGFMIGDAGYGVTTLMVFYAGYRMFPQIQDIFKSLMYASVATIIFGLAFGDAFGYVLFGSHSELAHATGIHLFEQIPILFHRAEHLGAVFEVAAIFGLFHVNVGYLLGAYNEYVSHGVKEAFLEKGSWIVLEIGAAFWYLFGATAGAPVLALSVVLLYLGEGVEGVVEIPSLLSNVLSYLRIFGVAVAAVALAGVVNAMAEPLFQMGGAAGFALGFTVLLFGHTFNTFIKIMEGFLQGIRLHYVELFTKFYEGGGIRYSPFGGKK
ncbi:MAG: V-type ATP synthase subunit I [Candidatus Nanohaloarchaea archaeon]